MRRAALIAWAWLAFAPAASAQPMLDPSQMSGIPRPDPQVPMGTLTVKVIRGELAAWAPVGTVVHLVGLTADGQVTYARAEVKDDGRAELKGLALDGMTAYYALCLLGDERLVSQPAILPPRVGVRMMLSGAKQGKPPVDDEARAHEGVQEAPPAVPAGVVEVMARGRVDAKTKVVLRSVADGATREPAGAPSVSDDGLNLRFTDVPAGAVYLVEATEAGRTYRSTPFIMSRTAGVRRMVLVYDKLLFAMQGGAEPEDEVLWFQLQMTVANVSGAPVLATRDMGGLVLPLPAGHRSASLGEDSTGFQLVEGVGVAAHGAIPPGQLNATVQFGMPIHDGKVTVDMPAPLGMFQSQIAILKVGDEVVSAPGGAAPRLARADDGREYFMLEGFSVAPGESLRFSVAGLPVPAGWQSWTRGLAAVIVVLLVAAAALVAVRRPRAAPRKPADGASARRELGQRRERLFAELVALERLRASQRIDASDFDAQRRAIMTKLVLVHRELDELDGGAPTS